MDINQIKHKLTILGIGTTIKDGEITLGGVTLRIGDYFGSKFVEVSDSQGHAPLKTFDADSAVAHFAILITRTLYPVSP